MTRSSDPAPNARLSQPPCAVAIPVRDEFERIAACLRALAAQKPGPPNHVVLLINNTTDGTAQVADALAGSLPYALHICERSYSAVLAHAGSARREAMSIAAGLVGTSGVLLTTDADGVVAPGWLAANLAALANGADVVCGRAVIDPLEALAIPDHLHDDDRVEVTYGTMLDRIHALADPDPADPWPRHTEHSGASIAVCHAAWALVDGVPALASGEDRAFIQALRRADRRIRHAPEVLVTVSGRLLGRAPGGMAETMARRILCQDALLDETLEPAAAALRRAELRAGLRALRQNPEPLQRVRYAKAIEVGLQQLDAWLALDFFGEIWAAVEAVSPALRRRHVRRADCRLESERAAAIIGRLERKQSPVIVDEKWRAPSPAAGTLRAAQPFTRSVNVSSR